MQGSCVYWIHLPEHTNPFCEGYIGVASNGLKFRLAVHKHAVNNGSQLHVHRAMRKYENYVAEVLLEGPPEYCYEMEAKLRPTPQIGWNIAMGGSVSPTTGLTHSDETKEKISAAVRGKTPSLADRLANSAGLTKHKEIASRPTDYKYKVAPWKNPNANEETWKFAGEVFDEMEKRPLAGVRLISFILGKTVNSLTAVHKKIKAGWNPHLDTEWLIFSGKLIPDASGDKPIETGISPI